MSAKFHNCPGRQIATFTDDGALSNADARKLRPGQYSLRITGDAARFGIVEDIWILPRPFIPTERGNVRIDFRRIPMMGHTPGVKLNHFDDGTITIDYSGVRYDLRRKGWLRVDPILVALGIDVNRLTDMLEDEHIEEIEKLRDPKVWQQIADFNDVNWRRSFLDIAGPLAEKELRDQLKNSKAPTELFETVPKAVKAKIVAWYDLLRESMKLPAIQVEAQADEVVPSDDEIARLKAEKQAADEKAAAALMEMDELRKKLAEFEADRPKRGRPPGKVSTPMDPKPTEMEGVSDGNV